MAWPTSFLSIARLINRPVMWLSQWTGPFSLLEHTGRRSGRRFTTPVRAVRRGEQVVMGASFGIDSDWVHNVLAADGCRLRMRSTWLDLTAPRVVVLDDVRPLVPPITRFILRRLARAEECVLLDVA